MPKMEKNLIKAIMSSYPNIPFDSQEKLIVNFQGELIQANIISSEDYFIQCQQLLTQLNTDYSFKDIRRELNTAADELANQAMDRRK